MSAGLEFAGRFFDRGAYDVLFLAFTCSDAQAALCLLAVDVTQPLVPRTVPDT